MTAPRQQQRPPLRDLEHTDRPAPLPRGPITFTDDASLQRRLERRGTDRRRRERRGTPTARPDLGTRELCHDLRQPLASAVLLAHMLEKEPGLTTAGRLHLELLRSELARTGDMLTAHLDAAAPVLLDVADLVREVCSATAAASVAPFELIVEEVPLVLGDGVQLTRLVANLVANARTAAGPVGQVRVHVRPAPGAVSIAVEDSGDAADSASTSGFGLGLLIVDAVLRRHRGRSTCTASDLGGLRVTVTLPAGLPQLDDGEDA